MENLTTMNLADELAASQDKIISGEEKLDLERIFSEIDSLKVLDKPIKDYLSMKVEDYDDGESDGKLTLLDMNQALSDVQDRILTNHVDGYVDKNEINLTYNHEAPFEDGNYDRATDLHVLLYSLKVIGAVRAIDETDLRKVLSKDAVLSLGLAANTLANN
ncbi:hypothetical protein NR996_05700 [Lactobacillus rodentium]|uniref:Uncharacterized protein n=1 Tax=Lactobacillus rodentium TaxID=947835 RepID=A0A2Z6TGQ0_9LACO|nr:hypothetical protein [Lactobacillus rodentium]MCR1894903.1 hypothetical protein [Lactobacillus rodentium]GBG05262.1 hypothetical protein LrDSM24759_11760 [Lactobacillus rodentium]